MILEEGAIVLLKKFRRFMCNIFNWHSLGPPVGFCGLMFCATCRYCRKRLPIGIPKK